MNQAWQYQTKDSGKRHEFGTGARRDTEEGKPRYDLIPPGPMRRLAELYARGAQKYGENNWEKGMPASRHIASLMRHVEQARTGETDEDHWAAIAWNAFAVMHTQDYMPEMYDVPGAWGRDRGT